MSDVFISYKREDAEEAKAIASIIAAQGYSVWWDTELIAGQRWSKAIKAELDAAKCVVVLLTRNSVEADGSYASEWVEREADEGFSRGILVPFLLEAGCVPWIHKSVQLASMVGWSSSELSIVSTQELLAGIERVAGQVVLEISVKPSKEIASLFQAIRTCRDTQATNSNPKFSTNIAGQSAIKMSPLRIDAICSPKGGVGATFMAISLAASMGRMGRRVLLVDGNLKVNGVVSALHLSPAQGLQELLARWVELKDAIVGVDGGAGSEFGFDVLPTEHGDEWPPVDAERYQELARDVLERYDHVLIDLPAMNLESEAFEIARACDHFMVVATEDPSAMTQSYALLKIMRGYAPATKASVSMNMSDTRVAGRRAFEAIARACQHFLGFRPGYAGAVLHDPKVRESLRLFRSVVAFDPETQASMDVSVIADFLLRAEAGG